MELNCRTPKFNFPCLSFSFHFCMKDSCSFKQLQLQLSFMQNIAAVEKETFDPNLSAVWDMGYCCFENLVHTIELVYVPVIHLFSGVPGLGVWDLCFEKLEHQGIARWAFIKVQQTEESTNLSVTQTPKWKTPTFKTTLLTSVWETLQTNVSKTLQDCKTKNYLFSI